ERGGGPPRQKPRRLDLGRHVSELELDRLEVADGPAECVPLLRVGQRAVEARLGDSDSAACDVDTAELERRQSLLKPTALDAAEEIVDGHAAIGEEHLSGFRSFVPQLVEVPADRK